MIVTLRDGRTLHLSTSNASGYVADRMEMEARDFKELANLFHSNPQQLYARLMQLAGCFSEERPGTVAVSENPDHYEDAPEWLWYGRVATTGEQVISFGRWPRSGGQTRYKIAEIQATEHDGPSPPLRTSILELRPGDVLVLNVEARISEETAQRLRDNTKKYLSELGLENGVLVLADGISLSAVRPGKDA